MAKVTKQPFPKIVKAQLCKVGESKSGIEDVQGYLQRFGYLPGDNFKRGECDNETSNALKKFQELHKLNKTGEFDNQTKEEMTQHRCGLPDLVDGVAASPLCPWERRDLTYAFTDGPDDVNIVQAFQAIRNAFNTWATEVNLTFTEVDRNENHDIEIGWRPSEDPDHSMEGGILAHADFPPGCSIITTNPPLPLHYDMEEHSWAIEAQSGAFDIETVGLHEIGHILGLMHSTVNGAVMFPTVRPNFTLRQLKQDDKDGIHSLYP